MPTVKEWLVRMWSRFPTRASLVKTVNVVRRLKSQFQTRASTLETITTAVSRLRSHLPTRALIATACLIGVCAVFVWNPFRSPDSVSIVAEESIRLPETPGTTEPPPPIAQASVDNGPTSEPTLTAQEAAEDLRRAAEAVGAKHRAFGPRVPRVDEFASPLSRLGLLLVRADDTPGAPPQGTTGTAPLPVPTVSVPPMLPKFPGELPPLPPIPVRNGGGLVPNGPDLLPPTPDTTAKPVPIPSPLAIPGAGAPGSPPVLLPLPRVAPSPEPSGLGGTADQAGPPPGAVPRELLPLPIKFGTGTGANVAIPPIPGSPPLTVPGTGVPGGAPLLIPLPGVAASSEPSNRGGTPEQAGGATGAVPRELLPLPIKLGTGTGANAATPPAGVALNSAATPQKSTPGGRMPITPPTLIPLLPGASQPTGMATAKPRSSPEPTAAVGAQEPLPQPKKVDSPAEAKVRLARARNAVKSGDLALAITEFEQYLVLTPLDVAVREELAGVYTQAERIAVAAAAYRELIRLAPANTSRYLIALSDLLVRIRASAY